MHRRSAQMRLLPFALAILTISSCSLYPKGPVVGEFYPVTAAEKVPDDAVAACDAKAEADLPKAIMCAKATRKVYGKFLLNRERGQVAAGFGIVTLAAGAAAVAAAGASAVAAASLGAAAGGGLGLDYLGYSKEKTKAYANATVRLQCVISDTGGLDEVVVRLNEVDAGPRDENGNRQPLDSLDTLVAKPNACTPEGDIERGTLSLARAKYVVARRREENEKHRLGGLPREIVSVVKTIDVRAFSASQSGVPDGDQIEKAVKVVGVAIPSPPTATKNELKAEAAAHSTSKQLSFDILSRLKEAKPCASLIQNSEAAARELHEALAKLQLPQPGFKECLDIKAFDDPTATAKSTDSSSKSDSKSGKKKKSDSSSGSDTSSKDKSSDAGPVDPQPALKPDKIAFQILPSDDIELDPGKPNVKILGGTPPYYWAVLDPKTVRVHQASQSDLFVTLQVDADGDGGRILLGDQDGAEEVISVKPKPKPKQDNTSGEDSGGSHHKKSKTTDSGIGPENAMAYGTDATGGY